jgi:ferric-dicitrate binding protein FerR (iron transport regulator)
MVKPEQAKQALPYLRGLADDEYVQEQIRTAVDGLASASRRIARKRGKAAEDKRLYDNLRQAATSVRNASRALQRRKPKPKRHGRKVIAVAVMAGGIALLISQKDSLKSKFGGDDASQPGPETEAFRHADSNEARVPDQPTATKPST